MLGAAGADHLRQAERSRHGQPLDSSGAQPAEDLIGDLPERIVEHGPYDAFLHQLLHRPPARSHRVKDDHIIPGITKQLDGQIRAFGEHAEVRHGDQRPVADLGLDRSVDE